MAADLLWQAGATAVGLDESSDEVVLEADVADGAALHLPWPVELMAVDEHEGLDSWRRFAAPVRAGERVVLQPAWMPRRTSGHEVVVRLDPGHAFGSGSHPTTRLVVSALERHLRPGGDVADVGCGSGVLSVTACLLGAARAVAVDVEPAAVAACRANAELNGVADLVRAAEGSAADLEGSFHVVMANISGRSLREMAAALTGIVAERGVLVLAGFLDEQTDDVRSAYSHLAEHERASEDGWTCLVLSAGSRQ